MTTLHMEVESVRGTHSNMVNNHSQLTTTLQTISSAVQNTVGSAWMGNSATEFLNEYEQWRGTMNNLLEQLNNLNVRLQNEISEWEAMAQRLA